MRKSPERVVVPAFPKTRKKKRRGIRRVMREIARPFEQVARSCRKRFKAYAYAASVPPPEIQPPQAPNASDFMQFAAVLEELRTCQALMLRRALRQPLATADGLLLMRLDDRMQLVPCSDFALIGALVDMAEYEPGVAAVLRRFSKDAGLIIDVGANIGSHTVSMARLLRPDGKLLALEPTPLTFRALQATIAANGLLERVEARQLAAGASGGECPLHMHPVSGQNSLIADPGIDNGSLAVPVATLDSLVSPATSVDLVKIDAEGAEFEILKGMPRILAENPDIVVVLEFSATYFERAGASPPELIDFMAARDLAAFLIDDADGRLSPLDLDHALAMQSANLAFGRRDRLPPMTAY